MEKTHQSLINTLNSSLFLENAHMKIAKLERGISEITMDVRNEMLNIHGFVHGGILFSLADTAAGAASFTTGRQSVTLNGDIRFLRPALQGIITAKAKEIALTHSTGTYQADIYDEKGRLLATSTFSMFFLNKESD